MSNAISLPFSPPRLPGVAMAAGCPAAPPRSYRGCTASLSPRQALGHAATLQAPRAAAGLSREAELGGESHDAPKRRNGRYLRGNGPAPGREHIPIATRLLCRTRSVLRGGAVQYRRSGSLPRRNLVPAIFAGGEPRDCLDAE